MPQITQGAPVTVYWDTNGTAAGSGNAGGTWDNATTANWTTNSAGTTATTTYDSADGGNPGNVIFSAGNNATGAFTVTVSGAVEANSITFEEGAITLAGTSTPSLTIDSGGVTINSTVSGATTFAASLGTVLTTGSQTWQNNSSQNFQVNSGVEIGKADTLTFGGTGATTVNGVISENSGSGANKGKLSVTGGKITFTNANTYSGANSISGGSLFVNNTTGSGTGAGAVNVTGSGTTLGGSGIITGAVSVASGNTLAPGATGNGSTAILNTGALTLSSGSNFSVDLNGNVVGTSYDQVSVTGTVNIAGSNLVLNSVSGLSVGNKLFILANDSNDAITGTFAGLAQGASFTSGGDTFKISYTDTFSGSANDISLTVTAVPEPSTWFAAGLAFLFIGYTQRRKLVPALKSLSS